MRQTREVRDALLRPGFDPQRDDGAAAACLDSLLVELEREALGDCLVNRGENAPSVEQGDAALVVDSKRGRVVEADDVGSRVGAGELGGFALASFESGGDLGVAQFGVHRSFLLG